MINVKKQIQGLIQEAIDNGTSQNQLAQQIGVSAATLVNVRKGNWKSISDKMVATLKAYFKITDWPLVSTTNLNRIERACNDSKKQHRMIAICGYTGAGKTTALRYVSRKSRDTYYMLADCIMTKKSFLQSMQQALGISEGSAVTEMMNAIVKKLNSATQPLLIIDDVGKLSHTIMRLIQVIYDRTEHSCGIILAGTEFLKEEIDRMSRKNRMGFRELRRRISHWEPMRQPTPKVVQRICENVGITDAHAQRYILNNCRDYGTIRNMITNALMVSKRDDLEITPELLEGLSVGDHHYEIARSA